jgi:thiol-disulfide isomerase/thioredoxin
MGVHKGLMAASLAVAAGIVGITAIVFATRDDGPKADVSLSASSTPDLAPTIAVNPQLGGKRFPDAKVETLSGDAVQTASLVGGPMIVNVWYAGCLPCKKELPVFAKLHAEFGEQIRFVGIDSLGPSKSEEDFARSKGVQYELYYDADGSFVAATGIATQPVTMFVRPDGTIAAQAGEVTEASLRQMIEANTS